MTDSDSYKAAFEYLYHSESTKDLPIQPQVIARVAKLIEQRDELLAVLNKYGNHRAGCTKNYLSRNMPRLPCNCGFDQVLDSVEGKT